MLGSENGCSIGKVAVGGSLPAKGVKEAISHDASPVKKATHIASAD
jgi:hypothetical protein